MLSSQSVARTILTAGLVLSALAASAQTAQTSAEIAQSAQSPAITSRPPQLVNEVWQLPPHTGEPNDENMRFTPAVVTDPRIEVMLYGLDSAVVRAAEHEGRIDLWNGMAMSPVAVTLRDRRNYVNLEDGARLSWIVRTNAIHTLYPVVKLANGTLIVGDRAITTDGEFLQVEVAFTGMRWYGLDPARVVVLTEVVDPDLTRVDEVGLATLSPGGGHGIAGSVNLSSVRLFAHPVPR
jgi:hypothetical protein